MEESPPILHIKPQIIVYDICDKIPVACIDQISKIHKNLLCQKKKSILKYQLFLNVSVSIP